MTGKHKIFLSCLALVLGILFVYIVFGKHGYADLAQLKREQFKSIQKNNRLMRENRALRIEIDRLKYDIGYIESIARQDLGMIRKEEIILKPKTNSSDQKP